ncbi:TPA_asm: hypothetical protein GNB58_004860 [Salmonella enterica subsp. houtenae serovar 45:g,z51:-]|uniref:Phage protein n=1 Tax=Salmonella enterica subsp. houtenae serovar 45:g,z51:- TaxID=1967611 RepID=A0A736RD96_SALHO|nr:hypothetical protein [Salmonella enterica subsp. houtenae str. CFSAN000557]HAE7767740.1 hypothetical protein [Salmonella enterica subsp. houtenae serovar 45:g,z51:-]
MDFDITGDETPEQLEAMLEKIGDVEVDGNGQEEDQKGATDSPASEQTQTESGDNTVPTPGTRAAEEKPQEEVKGILTRDGKHVIPYDVLEAERAGRQRAEQESAQLRQEMAEHQRKVNLLTSQINQAGMTPDPLPENAQITDEQIARVREMYPEMADLLTTVVRKYDYLQNRVQDVQEDSPAFSPVLEAMNAVPDLKLWQQSDPDRFTVAVHLDEKLQTDPEWKDKTLTERFAEVARRTRAAYGETLSDPVVEQDKNREVLAAAADKVAKADAAAALPDSPSDVGNTAAIPQDKFEQLLGASYTDAEAMMNGMSDADIDAILERLG